MPARMHRPCLCRQCRSRSVGFWRSHLIWICTVCLSGYEFISTIWIKLSDWLKIWSGRVILMYSAWQGLISPSNQVPIWTKTKVYVGGNSVCLLQFLFSLFLLMSFHVILTYSNLFSTLWGMCSMKVDFPGLSLYNCITVIVLFTGTG